MSARAFAPAFKESRFSPREIEVCGADKFFVCVRKNCGRGRRCGRSDASRHRNSEKRNWLDLIIWLRIG